MRISNFKSIRLLWNRFRTTFGDEKFYFEYDVIVETTQLGVFNLNPKRKQRLDLIYNLHLQEWSNKQISDHLNSKNLKTPRTRKKYTPKLIWMTIYKYKKSVNRNDKKKRHRPRRFSINSDKT